MFRLVVIIGLGCAVVIGVGLIDTTAGAIVLAAEVGIAIGILWRSSRGTLPRTADVADSPADEVHRVLVVANQTVGGRALLEEVRKRCRGRQSEIRVVVPALTKSYLEHWSSDVDGAIAEAQTRLDAALRAMADAGLRATGHVGDHHDPNSAIEDALREFPADEVIVSTLPPEKSRWLESGVVERAREEVPLPVTHVVVDLDAEAVGTAAA
jgi:GABA permease